jgi:GMP synthase (glutamine-hydrolysing)
MIHNFLFPICKCRQEWNTESWIKTTLQELRDQVGKQGVLLGLSGGVDSSVMAVLLHQAIGKKVTGIFVDNGLARAGEADQVEKAFRDSMGMNLMVVDARERFFKALKGVKDPERKRKIIGREFVRVFVDEARKLKNCTFLAQGTIYSDVIESTVVGKGPRQSIKSHHNVSGLPKDLSFELVEPLRDLFKEEVRAVGRALGLPDELVDRQPFPGPGMAVRILGEVTEERVSLLQKADLIVQEEMRKWSRYKRVWQSFAVLLPIRSVGVTDGKRTYEHVCALRVVDSADSMSADWTRVPHDILDNISKRLIHEVDGINRVVYDISSKPPATIEWE